MSKGKYQNKKHNRGTKTLVMLLALVLTLGCVIGGTVAWLTAQTTAVTNTFTVGNISILLKEHKLENGTLNTDTEVSDNDYGNFVPGQTLPKDPFVKVDATSEDCYLFIRVEEENNARMDLTGNIIQWEVNTDWAEYTPNVVSSNVRYFYRVIDDDNLKDRELYILTSGAEDDESHGYVKVNSGFTKEMATKMGTNVPKLIFNAAAVQKDFLTEDTATDAEKLNAAWNALPSEFKA